MGARRSGAPRRRTTGVGESVSGSGLAVQRKRERGSRRGSVAGARERRGRAREGAFAGPRKCVPLILGRTSSTNRILADAYSTPTTNPRMRITRDIPRHHIAVDTERCSVVVRARTGAAAASRDTGPAPDRRCGSRDAIAEHSAHPEPLPSAPSGEARPHKSTTAQTVREADGCPRGVCKHKRARRALAHVSALANDGGRSSDALRPYQ